VNCDCCGSGWDSHEDWCEFQSEVMGAAELRKVLRQKSDLLHQIMVENLELRCEINRKARNVDG
jgi:hypothetical protein